MAQQTLQKAAEYLRPTKAYIEACMKSPKRTHVFVLVEGVFDKHIYEKCLNPDLIHVTIATFDNLQHNRSSVQNLVTELTELYPSIRIIGIRDKDYSSILGQMISTGIYTTDCRDIEMMILNSQSFLKSDVNISLFLKEILPLCTELGYIRIFAENKNLDKSLNEHIKISAIYDQRRKCYVESPQKHLRHIYIESIDPSSTVEQLDKFIQENNLTTYSPYDICRGHDVVSLMGFVHGINYTKNAMEQKMEQYYSREDFYSTRLFSSINAYCCTFDIQASI